MPKKILLISAALTAFVLVISVGVVNAFKQANATLVEIQPSPTVEQLVEIQSSPEVEQLIAEVPTQEPAAIFLTPQEAALVAANYLEQTDIYSVEIATWEENEVYKVVFSSGDIVYVSFEGEIVGTEAPQVLIITAPKTNSSKPQSSVSNNNDHDDEHDDNHDKEDDDD